ncbi:CheR family methyltransferase [Hyphomicrobium sp.]|uniref:CheR family methyltransferase n=1 Tax=Hyphomicrobium sp. TaxID=82 RepID=UPI002E318060|nr:CheR family methyltransferase [Hyphomicrobium sp.]HEX2839742.1 CheR family methyltransferase [Hyphomicrobium sp.]
MHASSHVPLTGTLSDQHFIYLSKLIETKVGIRLPPNKRTMVEGRLRKRMKALGLSSVERYGDYIFENGALEEELPHLIDCMTTNKTDFFREPNHFNILVNRILPEILERGSPGQGRQIKIWSAASSIGAEAFTIAMVLDDALRGKARNSYSILGTDICTDVLRQATRAIYPLEMIAPVPPEMQRRYLMRARQPGRAEVRIVPELRRNVTFRHLNLMDPTYPVDRDMDVIFCRNILIYFSKPIQDAVVARLISHLRPGGYLVLGHSESMAGGNHSEIAQIVPTVFRKNAGKAEQTLWQPAQKRRYAS